jgi:hypothetical protein
MISSGTRHTRPQVRRRPASARVRPLALGALLAVAFVIGLGASAQAQAPIVVFEPPPGASAAADVSLRIEVSDPPRMPSRSATVTCRGASASATGFLADIAPTACEEARRLASFLSAEPESPRYCTMRYGGPQTARVLGTIGTERVRRDFSRTNGCGISDWDEAATLLGQGRPADSLDSGPVLVEYVRSGGIAGLQDRLHVTRSGRATLTGRGSQPVTFVVPASDLRALETALDRAHFPTLRPRYLPRHPIADAFFYTVTHRGITVQTVDTAVPYRLRPALDQLGRIVARAREYRAGAE